MLTFDLLSTTKNPGGTQAASARGRALLVVVASALCAACSGGFFPAPFATDPAPADSASAGPRPAFLSLAEITWKRGDEVAVRLSPDGTLRDHGVVLGKLAPDGVFTGRGRTFVMQPDGSVHVAAGFDIQIDKDGTAVTRVHGQPDESLTLAQVAKPRAGRPGLTLEGASEPHRRTAMWILMIPDLLRIQAEE